MTIGGTVTYVALSANAKHKLDSGLAMNTLLENVVSTLNSTAAFNQTVKNNPGAFSCIGNSCYTGPIGGNLKVYDESGTLIVDSSATSGNDLTGAVCNSYNPSKSDGNCVFRFDVTWKALCNPNPCAYPQVQVTINAHYSPTDTNQQINRTFTFLRGEAQANDFQSICQSLGGAYNASTNSCQSPWQTTCPNPGHVVIGIDPSTNRLICGVPFSASCPAGSFMRAVDANGVPACVALACTAKWKPPVDWTAQPPAWTYDYWQGGGGDGGGGDGSCDGSGGGGGCGK